MKLNLTEHPCFNDKARHKFGRIHLPVAPRCNIQCNFCDRKFDCVNESRPGVSSGILTPEQALAYLDETMKEQPNITVVGIAGPGDPFANGEDTIKTLRLVREKYPKMLLCVASNGLRVLPFVEELKELEVSHVTITLNAVDEEIAAKIYSWIRFGKRVYQASIGAKILLKAQLTAIKALKDAGIVVKINSIIIPGINDKHIPEIAKKVSEMGADILNCLPLCQNKESVFSDIEEPSKDMVNWVRKESEKYMPQMHHCTRCRADAVGLLGKGTSKDAMEKIERFSKIKNEQKKDETDLNPKKQYVAVATREGALVNLHMGEAESLMIYHKNGDCIEHVETRKTPEAGSGFDRWNKLAEMLTDCRAILVSGIGNNPKTVLEKNEIEVFVLEGLIDEAISAIYDGNTLNHMQKRSETVCGAECSGTAMGCG